MLYDKMVRIVLSDKSMSFLRKVFIFFIVFILSADLSFADNEKVYVPVFNMINKYPSELAIPSVSMQTNGYLNQLQSYNQAFKNMDHYMLLKKEDRAELKKQMREQADIQDGAVVTPRKKIVDVSRGLWARPYTTIEKLDLRNGPDVSNIAYGSYFGFDTELFEYNDDWSGNVGFYGAYNGSHQTFDGIGIYMNGGTFGAVGSLYKGNAFLGVTTSTGVHGGTANTAVGDADINVIGAGVAAKTGYNMEFKDGSVIVQPNFQMSYSYVNTLSYKIRDGFNVYPDSLHAIQLEPGLNLVWNLRNGWQPFANASFVWNLLDETNVRLSCCQLPGMAVKPYVKYGVGFRKRWNDRFALAQQTYIYQGGRNGVGFDMDCKIAVGKKY